MEHTRKKYARKGMTLYNGEVLAKSVCLGVNDSAKNWREIPDEEAEAIRAEMEKLPDGVEVGA